jgi:hypothetical protein
MSPKLKKWLIVLFVATPFIIYFLNLDLEALAHREIHGRRGSTYYLGDDMFWLQFFINIFYAVILAYASVQLITKKK